MPPPLPSPFYIVGPTASGKTAVALALGRMWGGEIINADAFQVYRGLEILTAQPSAEERSLLPHHGYGIIDPTETSDAASHAERVRAAVADVTARGQWPIIVGGSGLYIKALTHGLEDLPGADAALRETFAARSLEDLVRELQAFDPEAGGSIHLRNRRHVERALEICKLTGQPASRFKKRWNQPQQRKIGLLLDWSRDQLYQRIDARTHAMFTAGVEEEVARISALSPTAAKTIGIREIRALQRGEMSRVEAIASIQQATRRYAKRQTTWFKRETCFVPIAMDSLTPDAWPRVILQCFQSPAAQSS